MIESPSILTWKLPSESFKSLKEVDKVLSEVMNTTSYETNFKRIDQLKLKTKKSKESSLYKNIGEPFWEENTPINSENNK